MERFAWAIEIMDINPSDKILESGCGTGIAAEMVCAALENGHLTAIDRSDAMITKAKKRNAGYIKKKKVAFETVNLAEFHTRGKQFDKIFAFNVNLFWTQDGTAVEAKILRSSLTRKGKLYLFYQPPSPQMFKTITESVKRNLEAEHWKLEKVMFNKSVGACCFILKPKEIR
jgi:trans-aconitate methyltransferase